MKILVFHDVEPVLDIKIEETIGLNIGKKYGLHRDRTPDTDWNELRLSYIDKRCKEVELTTELKTILLEDLAYTYGSDSKKFNLKLKEFELI